MNEQDNNTPAPETAAPRKRRPLWLRLIKYTGIGLLSVLVLALIAITVVLWYLTPERLTPLVNDTASEYLMADVKAQRVELTFWSTFPHMKLQVDSLSVISRRFDSIPDTQRAQLPANPDSLLWLSRLSGSINIASLATGDIDLSDVEIVEPRINLVVLDDSIANFDIVPPSEASESSGIPSISINRFNIKGDMPVRYRAVSTGATPVDATLNLHSLSLDGTGTPTYTIDIDANALGGVDPMIMKDTPIALDGSVSWDCNNPLSVGISDFTIRAGAIDLLIDSDVDFTDAITVKNLLLKLRGLNVSKAIEMLPAAMRGKLNGFDSDLTVNAQIRVDSAFAPLELELPVAKFDIDAASTYVNWDKIRLHNIAFKADGTVDLAAPDRSVIDLKKLSMQGPAMEFTVSGRVTRPLSDPVIKGNFNGELNFRRLPQLLLDRLPFTIGGRLDGDADVNMRLSDLSREHFHRMRIDGELSLSDFHMAMRDSTMNAFMNHGTFHLGTSSKLKIKEYNVDSLLTASLTIDTVAFHATGIDFQGRNINAGVGSKNVSSSSDTTAINPIGARITADRIRLISAADSMRIVLREAKVGAALTRYEGESRSPLLRLNITADRIRYADAVNRASISRSNMLVTLHPKKRPAMSKGMKACYDSIASLHPNLSADSLMAMARAERRRQHRNQPAMTDNGREKIDFANDSTIRQWLMRWQASGSLTAAKARLFTPFFPARNILTDVDLTFSTDSVVLKNTLLRSGHSDFMLNGSILNISRAFTSRRRAPLELRFSVESDTIDLNDLAATAIRGAAFARQMELNDSTFNQITDIDDDENRLQSSIETQVDSSAMAAIVIPSNIVANMSVNARNIHYNDLWLRNIRGDLSVFDGAVNLEQFRGATDVGSFGLTALYSAPTINDISLAAGIKINRLNLHQFSMLLPKVDSLLPMLSYIEGIVDANLALTSNVDSAMNVDLTSMNMALKLSGDSLVLLDSETFRTVSKWMLFKNKKRNMIDRMEVEIAVHDGFLELYPFIFDIDRYKLGVKGSNDAELNLDYHVSVLKSPLPFKFGINLRGTPEKMKIRVGKAKINEKTVATSHQIVDTARVNLIREIRNVFRRGVRTAGRKGLQLQHRRPAGADSIAESNDTISHADSLMFIREGLIEVPKPDSIPQLKTNKKSKKKKK